MSRIDSLPSRSVNQYRGRDIFAYLALRYCVSSQAAKSDSWAINNAIHIVMGSEKGDYLRSLHFKQINEKDEVEIREIYVPSTSEALAEAALIAECSDKIHNYFKRELFSYIPSESGDRRSYFRPYMEGLRARQKAIKAACEKMETAEVLYLDVKSFYPSITTALARTAWLRFCEATNLEERYKNLGFKLIYNHSLRSNGKGMLTGPMFSHLIANIVLKPIDDWASNLPVSYFRYVDDMTLVGPSAAVGECVDALRERLKEIGFAIHDLDAPKSIRVSAEEWQISSRDFDESEVSRRWMRLIGDIKKFILFDNSQADSLKESLRARGYRIPILDYSIAIKEANTFQRIRELGIWAWLKLRTKAVSVDTILEDAHVLNASLNQSLRQFLQYGKDGNSFTRKRTLSKLRYILGRLVYLAGPAEIDSILESIREWPELSFHREILRAIATGDCSTVARFGPNVAQAAAQIFRAASETARFSDALTTEAEIQSLAVFILNGVSVEGQVRSIDHPLLRFAKGPVDDDLMYQPRGMLQELACLHGKGEARHAQIMNSAFDLAQDISLDALESEYGYSG